MYSMQLTSDINEEYVFGINTYFLSIFEVIR